jgi:hypothetical protein
MLHSDKHGVLALCELEIWWQPCEYNYLKIYSDDLNAESLKDMVKRN